MVVFSDTSSFIREIVTQTLSTTTCSSTDDTACRDDAEALTLKLIAIGSILVAGVTGISIPLIGSSRGRAGGFSTDSNLFIAAKAFAAGVILATGFVHMLPDASSNLTDSCLPTYPWSYFPFSGFIAMCSALLTLLADFIGTQMYESKEKETKSSINYNIAEVGDGMLLTDPLVMEESGINAHIIGVYAHADQHGHDHNNPLNSEEQAVAAEEEDGHGQHSHSHSHGSSGSSSGRHAVVSQVLELGIVSHSVIIGLSIGVSHSPCVIRPLVAALSFHQFFEGFALGGCISQAKFKTLKTALMATFFALTTPLGIGVGITIASSYDADSARALVIEGVLDAVSAGILIYMSLVDLIAADFMSKKMRCNLRLQIVSYFALFMGATLMSSLAIWS